MARGETHQKEARTHGKTARVLQSEPSLGLCNQSEDCFRTRYDLQLNLKMELGLQKEVRHPYRAPWKEKQTYQLRRTSFRQVHEVQNFSDIMTREKNRNLEKVIV